VSELAPQEHRRARREKARRRTRRQRRVTAAFAIGIPLLVLVAVLAARGPEGGPAEESLAVANTPQQMANGAPPRAPEPPRSRSATPGQAIPILMYHSVEAAPEGAGLRGLWLPADQFRAQVEMLREEGFHAITMRDAQAYWRGERRIPEKPIVLTFDDGYRSDAAVAEPVLREANWPGVLYLTAAQLKTPGPTGISKAQVRGLIAAGWELGGHTMEHPRLPGLDAERLRYEIAGSKRMFERAFGVPVSSFCYPAGKYDDRVVAAVRKAGYSTATTVDQGLARPGDPLLLRRIRIDGDDTAAALRAKLAGFGA
jgi:peptidoglycan/xylan/chitin deacetylase (PgdA/CDA1 family)